MSKRYFYETDSIDSKILTCPCCKSRYEQPVCLPCLDVVCFKCLSKLKVETFDRGELRQCPECLEQHLKQDDLDYKPSKLIMKTLELVPIQVTRGAQFENSVKCATNLCNDLIENIRISNDLLQNSEAKIADYCSEMKSKVDLFVEMRVDELNKHRDDFFGRIENYQKECSDNFHCNLKACFDTNSTILSSANEWLDTLTKPNCIESEVLEISKTAQDSKQDLEDLIINFNKKIFNKNKLVFKGYETKLDYNVIGNLQENRVKRCFSQHR
jgi:hypothetical protein